MESVLSPTGPFCDDSQAGSKTPCPHYLQPCLATLLLLDVELRCFQPYFSPLLLLVETLLERAK